MEKLNICLISLTFAPDTQDGAAKFFTGIYNYLKNQGHNVKVITGKCNGHGYISCYKTIFDKQLVNIIQRSSNRQ